MKYLVQLLNYKRHLNSGKSHAIIIKNLVNVNIFVQHNFKSVLIKIHCPMCNNNLVISVGYKSP